MSALKPLLDLAPAFHAGKPFGIASICTAHPMVLEATLRHGLAHQGPVLIEATCNQVNQDGGYTGMRAADFRRFVEAIAERVGFPLERLILGGDHLGPNPWRNLPADEAMEKAEVLVADYVRAGFGKIHLDASMACFDDPTALPTAVIAERATRLAVVAEAAAREAGVPMPVYVIGTEVPVPGGAHEVLDTLAVTTPEDAAETVEVHRTMFAAAGLDEAFGRVVGLVVQPGVEFGHQNVIQYVPEGSRKLTDWLGGREGLVFEAHSTDYQSDAALKALVGNGFGILKVGPGLTFALRRALYGLDAVAAELRPDYAAGTLPAAMEAIMLEQPGNWASHYHGDAVEQRVLRHFSYSDRIRYYWNTPAALAAVETLLDKLEGVVVPDILLEQYLPVELAWLRKAGLEATAGNVLHASVAGVLDSYHAAIMVD